MLNTKLSPDLNVALFMTTLFPTALGVTESEREYRIMDFPLKLNSTQVVFDWWLKNSSISIENENDKVTLLLLADAVSYNPRVCEFVKDFILIPF